MSEGRLFSNEATVRELTALQVAPYKDYYVYDEENKHGADKDGEEICHAISCPFVDVLEPIYWYSMTPIKFIPGTSGKEISFSTPPGFDYLCHTYLSFKLPNVQVDMSKVGEYQICWTPDICYHVTPSAKIKIGGMLLCNIDRFWMIFNDGYFSDANHEFSVNRDCGKVPELMEWNSELPSRKLKPSQPWYYSKGGGWTFPLWKLNSQTTLTHIYTMNLDLSKLIRMRKNTPRGWELVPVDLSVLSIFDNKKNKVSSIGQIDMYGEVAEITPAEKLEPWHNVNLFVIEDIVDSGKPDKVDFEQKTSIDFKTTNGITKASYWKAQNVKAVLYNDHSNFTTNWRDSKQGKNPLRKIGLEFDNYTKFDKFDADDFSGPLARQHFPSTPKIVGLHAIAYSARLKGVNTMGINAKDLASILHCDLVKKKHIRDEDQDSKFVIIARSQVVKYIKFEKGMPSFVVSVPMQTK